MRILIVTPYLPYPGADGGGTVMFNVIRNLSERHEVVCLSFSRERDLVRLSQLEPFCLKVITVPLPGVTDGSIFFAFANLAMRALHNLLSLMTCTPVVVRKCMSRSMAREIRSAVENHRPDLVHFCFPQMAHYVEECQGVPTVIDTVDVALLGVLRRAKSARSILVKAYYLLQWRFWVRYESRWFPRFGKVLTVTSQDGEALKKVLPQLDVYDRAIAVDIQPEPAAMPEPGCRIGFLASFAHQPNVDAALFFADTIFPLVRQHLSDAEFVVAGRNPPTSLLQKDGAGITCIGYVEDVPTFYGSVDLVVAPILYGGGIKIKVLEAMACGRPVVTTTIGAEGIAEADDGVLVIADEPTQFAAEVIKLLEDLAWRRELGEKGRKLIESHFSWTRLLDDLDQIYAGLTGVSR